jgi:hypothetical protein
MSATEHSIPAHHASLVRAMDVDAELSYDSYMNFTLTISSSSTSPSNIVIYVGGYPGDNPVVYSLGDVQSHSAGLQISLVTPGSLPLSTVNVTPNAATLQTASSGGGGNQWAIQLQGFLGAPTGTRDFQMSAFATDTSTAVQVAFNNGLRTPLTQNPTKFDWRPIG